MKPVSYRVADKLFLVRQEVSGDEPPKPVPQPTNHVVVIDCSGSMAGELPRVRAQLKAKLPKLLKQDDTVSIVWFSGRREFGVLLEGEPVATLKDLSDVQKAIDRWLQPVGLTGFKEPLEEATKLASRVAKKNPGASALFFMSDGCDNQWPRTDILQVAERAQLHFVSATFVEYGYYADRPLLAAMAEKLGGAHIFAEDFARYEPTFDGAMQKRALAGRRHHVPIEGDVVGGFAFALHAGDLLTFDASKGKVVVPEDVAEIAYLSPTAVGDTNPFVPPEWLGVNAASTTMRRGQHYASAYAALSLFAVRMKPDVVFPLLKVVGDVTFIEEFANCFGKQKYSEFMDLAKTAAFNPALRFTQGWNPKLVPAEDAFTVLQLLEVLAGDANARVLLDHPEWQYSRISRGRVDADENLTVDEQEKVAEITALMVKEKSAKKLKDLQAQLAAITSAKKDALQFVADAAPNGYPISSLTYNEERPNISLLVRKTGHVRLSDRLAAAGAGSSVSSLKAIPQEFPTFIYRNYAIVRDGLVNVDKLVVQISQETFKRLEREKVKMGTIDASQGRYSIHLKTLPVVNRKMVKAVSARRMAELEYDLVAARAEQKVLNYYRKEMFPKTSEGFEALYGEKAAAWLKEQGLTDYSGFSPKTTQAESKDFYLGKQLSVALKGYATLPSVAEVKKRVEAGKPLTGAAAFMAESIDALDAWLAKNPKKLHEKWITSQADAATTLTRGLIHQAAQIRFSIVVGQTWFTEFATLDEDKITISGQGDEPIEAKFSLKEVEIRI